MKPYLPSFERKSHQMGLSEGLRVGMREGLREGLLKGIRIGLEQRFPAAAQELYGEISQVTDVDLLVSIQAALWNAASVDDIRKLINQTPINN